MKTLKSLLSIMLFAIVIFATSCSKSDDPTPNLDSVKKAMIGTWEFQSVTVTENANGKTATTTSCLRQQLTDAKFTNSEWSNLTPLFTWVFNSPTSATGSNFCLLVGQLPYSIGTLQNSDGSVNIAFDAGGGSPQIYNLKSKDISSNLVTASLVENGQKAESLGYVVVYEFSRK